MFKNEDIPTSRRKLGWYEVDDTIYINKYHALENCANNEIPKWNFHDEIYSSYDWSNEPSDDLYELYRKRAQQLRDEYDYVILYYSGGIDSHTVLKSFIDNDIKIDGVVIYGSYSTTNVLSNIEQRTVALPYMERLRQEGKLYFPVFELDNVNHYNFHDENWVYASGHSLSPLVYSYNSFWKDPWMQNVINKGKTCFVRGIDKPRVILENDTWFGAFLDSNILAGSPTGTLSKNQDWDIQEYFFWTPDMPELAIKQAHVMVNWLERHMNLEEIKTLTTKNKDFDRARYNKYADPLMFGKYISQKPGEDKSYFSLTKPKFTNLWHKDMWFVESRDINKSNYDAWLAGLQMIKQKIDPRFFNDSMVDFTLPTEIQDVSSILCGSIGCWSAFHEIKKYTV